MWCALVSYISTGNLCLYEIMKRPALTEGSLNQIRSGYVRDPFLIVAALGLHPCRTHIHVAAQPPGDTEAARSFGSKQSE